MCREEALQRSSETVCGEIKTVICLKCNNIISIENAMEVHEGNLFLIEVSILCVAYALTWHGYFVEWPSLPKIYLFLSNLHRNKS
jgi:hypothetical protein